MELTDKEIAAANERGRLMRQTIPAAAGAKYDEVTGRLLVALSSGVELAIPLHLIRGLESASAADLAQVELSASGYGIHFPLIDGDVYVPALLVDFCGAPKEMA